MCFHYALSAESLENKSLLTEYSLEGLSPESLSLGDFNAFTFPLAPVIADSFPDRVSLFRWGLVPAWADTEKKAKELRAKTLNARSESIKQKPSFRESADRRCLILADSFYEWQETAPQKLLKYRIRLEGGGFFAFAGIYSEAAPSAPCREEATFSLLTTKANAMMERIHNRPSYQGDLRMPVLLRFSEFTRWLRNDPAEDAALFDRGDVELVAEPCPSKAAGNEAGGTQLSLI